jgi:hypothetical protein
MDWNGLRRRIDLNSETWQAIAEFLEHQRQEGLEELASPNKNWDETMRLRGKIEAIDDLRFLGRPVRVDPQE